MPSHPETECDVLVIGSGAGGFSAAVTAAWHGLKVIVVEKERVFGGTTAWSGGWMWIPRNPLAQRAGIVEDLGNDPHLPARGNRQLLRRASDRGVPGGGPSHGRLPRAAYLAAIHRRQPDPGHAR